jgi:hypothetical protein
MIRYILMVGLVVTLLLAACTTDDIPNEMPDSGEDTSMLSVRDRGPSSTSSSDSSSTSAGESDKTADPSPGDPSSSDLRHSATSTTDPASLPEPGSTTTVGPVAPDTTKVVPPPRD